MVYLLFAVCSYLYLLLLSKYKEVGYKTVIVFSLPVIFAWVLIIGSQYYVGTDYPTYLSLFKNIDSAKNEDTEFGFVYFVYLCNMYHMLFCVLFGQTKNGLNAVLSLNHRSNLCVIFVLFN